MTEPTPPALPVDDRLIRKYAAAVKETRRLLAVYKAIPTVSSTTQARIDAHREYAAHRNLSHEHQHALTDALIQALNAEEGARP